MAKAKPRLRKNPCAEAIDENMWQAIAPKGWHFNPETSYCVTEGCVYLCLEKGEPSEKNSRTGPIERDD